MKYQITYTMIYNGFAEVEADSYNDAMSKAETLLDNGDCTAPRDVQFGEVSFNFGEVTADYADELNED